MRLFGKLNIHVPMSLSALSKFIPCHPCHLPTTGEGTASLQHDSMSQVASTGKGERSMVTSVGELSSLSQGQRRSLRQESLESLAEESVNPIAEPDTLYNTQVKLTIMDVSAKEYMRCTLQIVPQSQPASVDKKLRRENKKRQSNMVRSAHF